MSKTKIRVSEIFYTCQGEGRFVGVPSVFLRTFGCNFSCRGFGMPPGQLSTESDIVAKNISQYTSINELPLVKTGCDSYMSWHPKFKHLSNFYEVHQLASMLVDLLPNQEWNREHLVITGGEPLLGWQEAFPELLNNESMYHLSNLTFETNGTQPLRQEFKKYLFAWSRQNSREITFSVSPKLSCSGESRDQAIQPNIIADYQEIGNTYLKFVVATREDVNEVLEVVSLYRDAGFTGDVYLMPIGGTTDIYNLNAKTVATLALQYGFCYSPRIQVDLFANAWGT